MTDLNRADAQLFLNWLEKQDPSQTYNYNNSDSCLVAQYVKAWDGVTQVYASDKYISVVKGGKGRKVDIPSLIREVARYDWNSHGWHGTRTMSGAHAAAVRLFHINGLI